MTRERIDRVQGRTWDLSPGLVLAAIVVVGLLVRLPFLAATGFATDTSTFESWALTLATHPLRAFYASAGFADYPPGYFYVLWAIGHLYVAFVHGDTQYAVLRALVKLPGVLADGACGVLIYAIARRFTSVRYALVSAAFFVFNPAAIFISAYWGQIDSFAATFTLAAILFVLRARDAPPRRTIVFLTLAWTSLAYSVLIKPPAALLAFLFIAFALQSRDPLVRRMRSVGTLCGIIAAFALAYISAVPFHAASGPAEMFGWLIARYRYGSTVYPYNSVNAFNIYAVARHFWSSDLGLVPGITVAGTTIGVPQYVLGIGLVLSATAAVVVRYLRRVAEADASFVQAAMLLMLSFFVLSTRMHERYVFTAFVLCMPLLGVGRRFRYAAILLSGTLFANLLYALNYLSVVTLQPPGVDATDIAPFVSHPLALINVLVLVLLAYVYFGGETVIERNEAADAAMRETGARSARAATAQQAVVRSLAEGLHGMTRVDQAIAVGWTFASFIITFVGFSVPNTKIFDEIYYARAAEEYIRHVEIFEFTHPPLTKLLITLSTMMFGDNAFGWRFLDLVVGALSVYVLYAFAKRLTSSTPFAAIAAGLLVFDGFHYVQSRIATPEITVSFFVLLTLYAFYRYWIATQVRIAPEMTRRLAGREGAVFAAGSVLAFACVALFARGQTSPTRIVLFIYLELGVYLLARLAVPRQVHAPSIVSYADGSFVRGGALYTPGGERVATDRTLNSGHDVRRMETSGVLRWEAGSEVATFTPDGTMQVGDLRTSGHAPMRALVLLALCGGCVAASKWNGLFDYFVVWILAAAVVSQPAWPQVLRAFGVRGGDGPPAFGNPRGISPDIVVAIMLFVGASVYLLSYIPYFTLGHSLSDVVELQHQMYEYHHNLHATHPYSSVWWQWPLLQIPVSYYYTDFRAGAATSDPHACCVAEILALPNPAIWWLGLISVPFVGYLAYRERRKGYLLLFVAYFVQWLPWAISPRLTFEYHFYPNLAIIILSDTILLQRLWSHGGRARAVVVSFLAVAFIAFVFWYPILAGTHLRWDDWHARMWTWLEGNNWINPHPGR